MSIWSVVWSIANLKPRSKTSRPRSFWRPKGSPSKKSSTPRRCSYIMSTSTVNWHLMPNSCLTKVQVRCLGSPLKSTSSSVGRIKVGVTARESSWLSWCVRDKRSPGSSFIRPRTKSPPLKRPTLVKISWPRPMLATTTSWCLEWVVAAVINCSFNRPRLPSSTCREINLRRKS